MSEHTDRELPESTALLANLEETRREVVIPDEYAPLLDSVERYFGVHEAALRLLTELYHPLGNPDEIESQLSNLCGGMFHYFERSEDRERIAGLLDRIFSTLYAKTVDAGALANLVGIHLEFVDTLGRSRYADSYSVVIEAGLENLERLQRDRGAAFLRHGGLVRRLARRSLDSGMDGARISELYSAIVGFGLVVFDESVDLERWSWSEPVGTAAEVLAVVAGPLDGAIQAARQARETARSPEELLGLPSLDGLLDMVLTRARELPSPIERIALYVHLAGVEELEHRNMEILRALYQAIRNIADDNDAAVIRAVDLITGYLGVCKPAQKTLLYKCLEKLGGEIANREDPAVVRHFVDRTIATSFEAPDIRGVSEEWQTYVNPHHLPCLRTWLAIIESNPVKFEQLLSALVINLHVKGVFVSDTDLFQRDISRLLNSDIADAFNLIMQLLGNFPVFFNEVGSEGELREVSTRIDQITHRRDPIVHYLRKQSHAESNNRLVGFAAAVLSAWRTGDVSGLEPYLPRSVFAGLSTEADWFRGVHDVVSALFERGVAGDDPDALDPAVLESAMAEMEVGRAEDRERVVLLVRMYQLLKAKYDYSPDALLSVVELSPLLQPATREAFADACDDGDHLEIVAVGNRVLEELRATIVSSETTEAFENIFHKRHIAAGIPSMYGTYREPKFDAMGLLLRMMVFLKPHLEACIAGFDFRKVTNESVALALRIMKEMLAGLAASGLRVRHLETQLHLLEKSVARGGLSVHQYLNILDFMSEALNTAVATNYISLHGDNLERLVGSSGTPETITVDRSSAGAHSRSERFLRDLMASTFGIQEFDLFLRRSRRALRRLAGGPMARVSDPSRAEIWSRLISFLGEEPGDHEDQLLLGFKGFSLKRLKMLGVPVPDGFVVSSELFTLQPGIRTEALGDDVRDRIVAAAGSLEAITGRSLGDPSHPLLLSVRSGAAFSMPGMMDTILNVGLNVDLLRSMSLSEEREWGAWDSYRRYLQNVAMSSGVDRDVFDDIMFRHKRHCRVERKEQFTARQMRDVALVYREATEGEGVTIHDDPTNQLIQAVELVVRSWYSEPARLFRTQLQLADEWGTAVVVQSMVFGNMSPRAGSGVVFTRNPRVSSTGVGLYGDFTLRSQGEDVVAGLVHPYPVSEAQRAEYSPQLELSMETELPETYEAIRGIAKALVNQHGFEHQEIEFTFESDDPDDLHILQIRPMRSQRQHTGPFFVDPELMEDAWVSSGIGVSGGAMSGRAAFSSADVERCRSQYQGQRVILLRPDTVPEDIGQVLAVDGVLTARGGFTSHAAVTAKRLGKCCVVNCADMEVDDANGVARIGPHAVLAGDMISMDGATGRVYLGEHEIQEKSNTTRPQ